MATDRLFKAKLQLETLENELKNLRSKRHEKGNPTTQFHLAKDSDVDLTKLKTKIKLLKLLKGHYGKIYSLDWSQSAQLEKENPSIVSVSQDGKMIFWDAISGTKSNIIAMNSAWIMSVAFGVQSK